MLNNIKLAMIMRSKMEYAYGSWEIYISSTREAARSIWPLMVLYLSVEDARSRRLRGEPSLTLLRASRK